MARPRSAQAHRKVLNAAVELFSERGIDATSMDAIAEASGVSKATIYKHWPDKDALCLEVMAYLHGLDEEPPVFDSGDLRADLIAQLRYQPGEKRTALRERILPHLIAYSARNHEFGKAWRKRALTPAHMAFTDIIRRGQQRGSLRRNIDLDVAMAIILGPMIYRRVFLNKMGDTSLHAKDLEVQVADAFLAAFGTGLRAAPAKAVTRAQRSHAGK
jgi:AcrR family transcriptional regulator